MNLSLSTSIVDDQRVLDVRGEVDVHTAPDLSEELQTLITPETPNLIVDLSDTGFIDSTGLGVLVAGQNRASGSGGSIRLVCAQERVLKLFRITGLDAAFAIHPTVPDAVAAS